MHVRIFNLLLVYWGYHVFDTTPTSFLMTPVQDKHE